VATVCQAVNGHRAEYIAVINDSTGEQFYNERALWRIAAPGFDRLLLAVFAGLFFWLLLVAVVAWGVVVRSQVRRFQYIGVGPILSRANSEANALRKPWAALTQGERVERVVAGDRVAAEGTARLEALAHVHVSGGGETGCRPGLQVQPGEAASPGDVDDAPQHGPADAPPACLGGGVHRLELAGAVAEELQRPDAEHLPICVTVTEERDRRVDETVHVERERVLRRRLGRREREMPLEQCRHVRLAGIVNGDGSVGFPKVKVTISHLGIIRDGCYTDISGAGLHVGARYPPAS
jgi:hypothetical protein